MKDDDGLIWAYRVDEHGRGESVGWNDLATREHEYLWIHLELEAGDARRWLREESGLSDLEAEVLLAEETRPRVTPVGDGLVLILRGVNLNPGAEPEDMISVRLWADANRVITVRRQRLLALEDLRGRLVAGSGARSVGEFVTDLADRLVERMAGVLGDLDDTLDAIDAAEDAASASERRTKLHELRREAVTLRRHLLPQRDALARLSTERIPWLADRERLELREVLDRTTRYVEDLDEVRERAAVTQEELASRLSEQLNRRIFALSIVAGIFLPLSFATGLLGINVAGIPGAENAWAFWEITGLLVLLAGAEILLFRRLRWL